MSILAYSGSTTPIYKATNRFPDFRVFRAHPTLIIHTEPYSQGF